MSDRELLEWAAKAYWGDEIDDVCSVEWDEGEQAIAYTHGDNQDHNGCDQTFLWRPLEDNGDALRLAVKRGICLDFAGEWTAAYSGSRMAMQFSERHGNDPYAATRRAIVRAAAAIGKGGE